MEDSHSSLFNLGILYTVTDDQLHEILDSYNAFCNATQSLLLGGSAAGDIEFVSHVHTLCKHGLESLVCDHFLKVLEETFQRFWRHFVSYAGFVGLNENDDINVIESVLCNSLEQISLEKQSQEKCLLILAKALQSFKDQMLEAETNYLTSKYQWIVSSVLMTTLPRVFHGL